MTRGYFWQALQTEIVDEFSALGRPMQLSELLKIGAHIIERSPLSAKEPLSQALRNRRLYARSVSSGQCVKCSQPARDGLKTCAECCAKASERNRLRRTAMRERLPDTRFGTTQRFTIYYSVGGIDEARKIEVQKVKGYITANVYPGTNRLGEIFIRMGKSGSSEALLDEWAKMFCMLLQHHVPLEEILHQCEHTQFRPDGQVKGMEAYEIRSCTSLPDLIAKWLRAKKFDLSELNAAEAEEGEDEVPVEETP